MSRCLSTVQNLTASIIYTKERVKPGKDTVHNLDRILLQALDLTMLPQYTTLNQIHKALKIRISADKMIAYTINTVSEFLSQENHGKTA